MEDGAVLMLLFLHFFRWKTNRLEDEDDHPTPSSPSSSNSVRKDAERAFREAMEQDLMETAAAAAAVTAS